MKHDPKPWLFLEDYRGDVFKGEWPTIPELFTITARRHPDRACFTCYDPEPFSLTYAEALVKIHSAAAYLLKEGLKKGDCVALTGKNSPEWAVAYLAILFAGGVVVPIDYQLKNEEVVYLLGRSRARYLFVDEEKYDALDRKKLKLSEKISLSPAKENYIFDVETSELPDHPMPACEEMAAILFTSGTTGTSKGVMLSHKNFVSDCFYAQGNMNIYSTDVFYAMVGLHHSYPMLAVFIEAISVGAELVFAKRIAIQQILKDMKQGKITMFLSVPLLFNKIIKALMKGIREKGIVVYGIIRFLMAFSGFVKKLTGLNLGKSLFRGILAKVSLEYNRICISGGGPLPASTFRRFNQMGIDFVQGYGLTETSPIVALNPVFHYKESSVGKLIPGVAVKILDPDEEGRGEIAVKGPNVMLGYFEDEEATAEIMMEDGYLKTGDVGYLDHENYLYLTGRKKSLIVTEGGKNVYPEEIEDKFQLYDEIEQILVKGFDIDRAMKTEGIEAYIYPAEEYAKDKDPAEIEKRLQEIINEVNHTMLPYQRIARLKVLDEPLEMTTSRKIKRFKVD